MSTRALSRVVRRETHSPRTVLTVVVLVLTIAVLLWASVEIVLRLAGHAPLLVSPGGALAWLEALPMAVPEAAVVGGAIVAAVAGVAMVWFAVGPGRLPKHRLGLDRHAVVVDNGVIASAVADRIRRELDLSKNGVTVGVGHRAADVHVRPEPGQVIEVERIRNVVEPELAGYRLTPALRVRVRVEQRREGSRIR